MKIAIIGSNSFLAQYIIRKFVHQGFQPTLFGITPSIDNPQLEFFQFSFPQNLPDFTSIAPFDLIIYTAGAGVQANLNEPSELIYQLNSFIPINLTLKLSEVGFIGKLITFGSYFEIGNESEYKLYTESDLVHSQNDVPNHYCISKRLLTRYLASINLSFDFFHIILPNIYGKYENPSRIIPYIVNSIVNKTEVQLTSGIQYRQFLHAADVAETAFDIAISDYDKGLYNLCNEDAIMIQDLVKQIYECMGVSHSFDYKIFGKNERNDTSMRYLILDNTKALNTFRFKPQIDLQKGIASYLS